MLQVAHTHGIHLSSHVPITKMQFAWKGDWPMKSYYSTRGEGEQWPTWLGVALYDLV